MPGQEFCLCNGRFDQTKRFAMRFGDILVCIDESSAGRDETERIAFSVAARSDARIIAYSLAPGRRPAAESVRFPPAVRGTEEADVADMDFERKLNIHNLQGEWILGSESHVVDDIAKHARCVDLVIVSLGDPDNPPSDGQGVDLERLVVECGRPVLGIPVGKPRSQIGRSAMVAWDGSRECARALHDATPFLSEAETVEVVSIGDDTEPVTSPGYVVAHLERLGIAAKASTERRSDLPVGRALLSRVQSDDVDLLVAGAFGHQRVWEHLFGGPSMTLLHQRVVPVLVSH